uniref:Uncharacterized protein n=1 Tax=Arundo donax TaxID=35708 RepID=A0A0A9A0D0_ARUDO
MNGLFWHFFSLEIPVYIEISSG